ncbi:extracellular solute-binding protein [Alicyclobacillus acidiphilus]|uniref:extracellular solute-binding protein n=1 Tax=Alicyclobacillus acidiphilus TaxID=182455 RepID=UPI00082CB560|nr:extracellular solute-binding protein [Alicyclobacillus acidiphilus]
MKRSRLIGVAGALVAIGGGLAGCGIAQSGSETNTSTASTGNASVAPITITFWNAYSETDSEEKTIVNKIIPEFEKTHPGITVQNVTLPYSNMQQKLLTSAAGNQLPDVARLDIIWMPQLAKLGVLVPQQKLSGWTALSKKVFPGSLSTNYYNGQYYGLPLDTNTKVLFSNPAVLKAHGIQKPPATMAQFIADIKKVSGGTGKNRVYGYDIGGDSLWNLVPWIDSYGGSVLSPNMKTATGYLNGPKTYQAINTLVSLYKAGDITGVLPGATGDMDGLAKGEYAFIDEGPWDVPSMAQTYPKVKYNMSLWPAGPAGSVQVVGGEDIGIFNTDPAHEKAAWEFEQFMLSTEAQTQMQAVGQMSVLKTLPQSNLLKGLDYFNIFRKQLATAKARPSVPQFTQIEQDIETEVTKAIQGKETVKQALDNATKETNELLAE